MRKEYTNPILSGFYPDPSICRAGDDYYLVCSTFAYFPGIPVFHSKDLVNWKLTGHVIDRKEQMDLKGLGVSKGIFAPTIRYYKGIFYLTCTVVDGGGNFIVTAKDPAGPWSQPVWLPEVKGIDPSLFFDEDGKACIVYNSVAPDDRPLYKGHRTIRMKAFDPVQLQSYGEEIILVNGGTDLSKKPIWIEGPHLYKKNDYYFLIAAEGGTGYDHSVVAFRSRSIKGPFIPYEGNPILTHRSQQSINPFPISSTGHADLVETAGGGWQAVFLGCRPYAEDHYNTGRESFLVPVTWKDDWPLLNEGFPEVQYRYPLPLPEQKQNVDKKYSGNFSYREDFEEGGLNMEWMFLRTPDEKWWGLSDKKGFLSLKLRPETCSGNGNPSFLARRQQHLHCAVGTSMLFNPAASNEKAGLAVFQNEDHFYFLCQSMRADLAVIELYSSVLIPRDPSRMQLEALQTIALHSDQQLCLKIEALKDHYAFSYRINEEEWKLLAGNMDARFLSTCTAGGFVGCTFALYATSLGKESMNKAYFDWFEYEGEDHIYK
jgi:xylan 1,4-beta-xylosidase